MEIDEMIRRARELGCSDLHLCRGLPPVVRRLGELEPLPGAGPMSAEDVERAILQMSASAGAPWDGGTRERDFAYQTPDGARQRVNLYRQNASQAAAVRLLSDRIPTLKELGMPPVIERIAELPRGLVLVTGPTGSGKSTTLAAMLDLINTRRRGHILTLEDPVEYRCEPKGCLVSQREIGADAVSFGEGLRAALREDPDVILVGEMRDRETIAAALTAAETGHLVLSTLHTTGAASTVDRIIDVFEPGQQAQIRTQLSATLRAVVSQQLLPRADGSGRAAALEVLVCTPAVSALIRDGKSYQIDSAVQTGARLGMVGMDVSLANLVRNGTVARASAEAVSVDREAFARALQ